jgi:hypothetical protein
MPSKHRYDGEVEIQQPLGLAVSSVPLRMASYTCNHCNRVVICNPDRTRSREWCAKCDRYICDCCGAVVAKTGECVPMAKLVAQVQDAAEKQLAMPKILVPSDVY